MASIDNGTRSIVATLLIGGPRGSGRSSLLSDLRRRLPARQVAAPDDQIADGLLEWLPLDLGEIGGWQMQIQLHALGSTPSFESLDQVLLARADGLLLLIDSRVDRLSENLAVVRRLQAGLAGRGGLSALAIVVGHSKQDLPGELVLDSIALDAALPDDLPGGVPINPVRGDGVPDALRRLVEKVLANIQAVT